jgi:hypothetical protein
MNGSSHPDHENHKTVQFLEDPPPQGLSEAQQGCSLFANILTDTNPPRGAPLQRHPRFAIINSDKTGEVYEKIP